MSSHATSDATSHGRPCCRPGCGAWSAWACGAWLDILLSWTVLSEIINQTSLSDVKRGVEMSAMSVPTSSSPSATQETAAKGHIGLIVLASIAAGLVLGLVLVLAVFAGADEPRITGSALVALGAGFALVAIASARFTSQPQPWARVPGVASMLTGVVLALM